MSYLGNTPTTQNFISGTDQFTGNGSTINFTLSRQVNSPNDIEVVIANVVQNPLSYSVSGNTLTISPAVGSGVVIYVRYLSTTTQSVAPGQRTVGVAQLSASGTADATTYLRGDNMWAAVEGVPAGAVMNFARNTPPTGWLKANGAAVSRTTYAALFAAIGTTFGVGDGSTTFNLPDLRAEFQRGWDDGRGIDSGRVFGSTQTDTFASHIHTTAGNFVSTYTVTDGNLDGSTRATGYDRNSVGAAQTDATGGTETRPRNIALLSCIKT